MKNGSLQAKVGMLKKIIYSAKDSQGNDRHGYVDAHSNADALEQLAADGLSGVILHDDAAYAIARDDLLNVGEDERARLARFELKIRQRGSNVSDFLLLVVRTNKYLILTGLAVLVWGAVSGSVMAMSIGLVVALSMPALSLWNYRTVSAYDRLQRTCALGEWDQARRCIGILRPRMTQPEMAFDLDVREACMVARENGLQEALLIVEKWKDVFVSTSPGLYESRISVIYHVAGDYQGFLDTMREGCLQSVGSSSMLTDLALAEARLGDADKAAMLLARIRHEELPPHALPFVLWVQGLVACRRNEADAVGYLSAAVSSMLEFGENPAVWTSLAMCSGAYASALLASGDSEKAGLVVKDVWKILQHYADAPLLDQLAPVLPGDQD